MEALEELGKTVKGVVVTRVRGVKTEMPITNIRDMLELPILAVIPEERFMQTALVMKNALVHTHPRSKAARAYRRLAAKIIGNNDYKEKYTLVERIFGV